MAKKYKWGILTAGKMAAKFTRGLQLLDNAELILGGCKSMEAGQRNSLTNMDLKNHLAVMKKWWQIRSLI